MNLSATIAHKRRELGVTQEQLANHIGITKASVSKWETGQSLPNITLIPLLAEYAYAKRGDKVLGLVSGKKYKHVSIVAALMNKKIVSPLQYDGAMDSTLFELWFEQCLIPELPPDSVIIIDNAYPQEGGRTKGAVLRSETTEPLSTEKVGLFRFPTPYNPEFNLIEYTWSWVKSKLKKVIANFECFDDALRYCFR